MGEGRFLREAQYTSLLILTWAEDHPCSKYFILDRKHFLPTITSISLPPTLAITYSITYNLFYTIITSVTLLITYLTKQILIIMIVLKLAALDYRVCV